MSYAFHRLQSYVYCHFRILFVYRPQIDYLPYIYAVSGILSRRDRSKQYVVIKLTSHYNLSAT